MSKKTKVKTIIMTLFYILLFIICVGMLVVVCYLALELGIGLPVWLSWVLSPFMLAGVIALLWGIASFWAWLSSDD